jgi:hypothetical protein
VDDDDAELVLLKPALTGRMLRKPSGDGLKEMAAFVSRQTTGEQESMPTNKTSESRKYIGSPRHSGPTPSVPRPPRKKSTSLADTFKKDSEKKDQLCSDADSVFTSQTDGSDNMYYSGNMSLAHVQPSEQVHAAQLMIGVDTTDENILHVKF